MVKGLLKWMIFGAVLLLTACYSDSPRRSEALPEQGSDSLPVSDTLTFSSTHHYSVNYNFVVKADSVPLLRQQPEEQMSELMTDSFSVRRGEPLVVADVRTIPNDSIDSVWVQVATVDSEFGWIHESELLPAVVPDDPISQFISFFSDTHILISLIIIILLMFGYTMRHLLRQNAHLVFLNDIDSFYPTLLALIVAVAATLYAAIQMFAPDVWRHFYYHPTLNPFSVPLLLGVFLSTVWAMLIVGLAAADDVRRQLPLGDALMYLAGLGGVCAVEYIVFSITTLYYIGYVLLVVYVYACLRYYDSHYNPRFLCGHCGRKIRNKGRCPYCGTVNV